MENIAGIFRSVDTAEQAIEELIRRSIPGNSISLLSKESPARNVRGIATHTDVDPVTQPGSPAEGSGKNAGTTLGVAIGGAAGFTAGATAATLLVPGLGVIFAAGLGAAALLGLGGAAAGRKLGDTVEDSVDQGASQEQAQFYRQLLERGDSLVIVDVRGGTEIATVRDVFLQRGSLDVETARRELREAA